MREGKKMRISQSAQMKTFLKLLTRLRKYRLFLIASILAAAITVATTLYIPVLIGKAIDQIVSSGNVDFHKIAVILTQVAVIIFVTGITQWIMNLCNNKVTYHMTRDIRNEAIERIEILPLKYIDGHSHGDIVSRIIADVDQFADGLLMGFTQFFLVWLPSLAPWSSCFPSMFLLPY